MLTMTQAKLNVEDVHSTALEFYGFQSGPVVVTVTDQMALHGNLHRLSARYAFMFDGQLLRRPTQEELQKLFPNI